ncbi:hypothetical protein [Microlunatus ginsengisoli]|uniref:Uncharacterized protein n=1 Tax=Microlunatus ginsengisoli TaxID=363863 RepID=A0ABP7ALI6_9ACTN
MGVNEDVRRGRCDGALVVRCRSCSGSNSLRGLTVGIPLALAGIAAHHAWDAKKEGKEGSAYLPSVALAIVAIVLFVICYNKYTAAKAVCDQINTHRSLERSIERSLGVGHQPSQADLDWITNKCDNLWG